MNGLLGGSAGELAGGTLKSEAACAHESMDTCVAPCRSTVSRHPRVPVGTDASGLGKYPRHHGFLSKPGQLCLGECPHAGLCHGQVHRYTRVGRYRVALAV